MRTKPNSLLKFEREPTVREAALAFTLLIIIMTILFLWGELGNLGLSKPINDTKFGSYFASIGALATAFSLYLIYQQSKLMSDANELAYSPDVRLKKSYHITLVYKTKEEGNTLSDGYSMKFKGDGSVYDDYFIKIINHGKSVAHEVTLRDNITNIYYQAIGIKSIESALKNEILKEDIQAINPDEVITVYWSFAIEFIVNNWYKDRLLNDKKRIINIDSGFELLLQYFDSNNREFNRAYQLTGHLHRTTLNEREVTLSLRLNEIINKV